MYIFLVLNCVIKYSDYVYGHTKYYTVRTDMPPEHACATIAQIICANPIHCAYCC